MKKNKAIFLDRDGVINKEINYLHKIEDFEFTKNCIEALKILQLKGYLLFVITNQAGIGRGYYTESDFNDLNSWMLTKLKQKGVFIKDTRYCPHHADSGIGKYKVDCECRKPKIGMLTYLIDKYDIDIGNSILVGDKMSDINAGFSAQIGALILVRSGHQLPREIPDYVSRVCEHLFEYANSMVEK